MSFDIRLRITERVATIELHGELDAASASRFHDTVDEAAAAGSVELVIKAEKLTYMASAGLRSLVFARQKMGDDVRIAIVGATEPVAHTIRLSGFDHSIDLIDA